MANGSRWAHSGKKNNKTLWSVSVLLQIIVMDYWFQTAQYCSSTHRLPPWRTLSPIILQPKVVSSPAHGLIDVMWTPSFVLIKKLLCWFVLYCVLLFFCKDVSANVKVSGPLYQYGFFHHATILCVPIQAKNSSMQHSLLHHKPNNTPVYTLKYFSVHCLLLPVFGIRPFFKKYFFCMTFSNSLFLFF